MKFPVKFCFMGIFSFLQLYFLPLFVTVPFFLHANGEKYGHVKKVFLLVSPFQIYVSPSLHCSVIPMVRGENILTSGEKYRYGYLPVPTVLDHIFVPLRRFLSLALPSYFSPLSFFFL